MVNGRDQRWARALTIERLIKPSSQPRAGFTQIRTWTRASTNMNARIVNRSATVKNTGPLFCLPPGGGCDEILILIRDRVQTIAVKSIGKMIWTHRKCVGASSIFSNLVFMLPKESR